MTTMNLYKIVGDIRQPPFRPHDSVLVKLGEQVIVFDGEYQHIAPFANVLDLSL